VNCRVTPFATLALAGVTPIDTSTAGVTVRITLPDTPPLLAETVVSPMPAVRARPIEPAALLIVATPVFVEDQVTCVVRSCVELSEKTPVAVNCRVIPFATLGFAGVTPIDTSTAGVTVNVVLPVTPPLLAETVVLPTPVVVAKPFEPAPLLMIAAPVLDEDHVTSAVTSLRLPSVNIAVAANCAVVPAAA